MEKITCQPYDIKLIDKIGKNEYLAMHFWAMDNKENNYFIRIEDFTPFVYLELPEIVNGKPFVWNTNNAVFFMNWVNNNTKDEFKCIDWKLVYMETLQGTNPRKIDLQNKVIEEKKFPMILIFFRNIASIYQCKNLFYEKYNEKEITLDFFGKLIVKVHEDNISQLIKLTAVKNFDVAAWLRMNAIKVPDNEKISEVKNEYYASSNDITTVPIEESKNWQINPKVWSIDIEVNSEKGNFPEPKNYPDKIKSVQVVEFRASEYSDRENKPYSYIFAYGEVKRPLENGIVYQYESEMEMINAFLLKLKEKSPEFIIGYNILGFDYRYIGKRFEIYLNEITNYSKLNHFTPELKDIIWESAAYGKNYIWNIIAPGRISVDMLMKVRRDYKLPKNDLDTVSNQFLGMGKHDVSPKFMFKTFAEQEKLIQRRNLLFKNIFANYQHFNKDFIQLLVDLFELIKRTVVLTPDLNDLVDKRENIIKQIIHFNDGKIEIIGKDEEKYRDMKNEFIQVIKDLDKVTEDYEKIKEYGEKDSLLVMHLFRKLKTLPSLMEEASVASLNPEDLYIRGQQIRGFNQLYRTCYKRKIVINRSKFTKESYKGAFVYEPEAGLYSNIIVLDFKSLYPSIIMAWNLCYKTLVPPHLMDIIPDELCHVIEWTEEDDENFNVDDGIHPDDYDGEDFKRAEKNTGKKFKFKFLKTPEGVVPETIRVFLNARQATRDSMKPLEKRYKIHEGIKTDIFITEERIKELEIHLEKAKDNKEYLNYSIDIEKIKEKLKTYERFKVLIEKFSDGTIEAHEMMEIIEMENMIIEEDRKRVEELKKKLETSIFTNDDIVELNRLEEKQKAYKVSANSIYGFTGTGEKGILPRPEIAMCTTAIGRELINKVNQICRERGYRIIYNDTDSTFIYTGVEDAKLLNSLGKQLSREITAEICKYYLEKAYRVGGEIPQVTYDWVKKDDKIIDVKFTIIEKDSTKPIEILGSSIPLSLDFEKSVYRILLLRKKFYAAILMDEFGNPKMNPKDFLFKGIALARRDKCGWMKEVYRKVLMNILTGISRMESEEYIIGKILDMKRRIVRLNDFIFTRTMGANYKSASYPMRIFGDRQRVKGMPIQEGEKIDYVVCNIGNPEALMGNKMFIPEKSMYFDNKEQFYVPEMYDEGSDNITYEVERMEKETMIYSRKLSELRNNLERKYLIYDITKNEWVSDNVAIENLIRKYNVSKEQAIEHYSDSFVELINDEIKLKKEALRLTKLEMSKFEQQRPKQTHKLKPVLKLPDDKEIISVDYDYYVTNVLEKQVTLLFSVGYQDELKELDEEYEKYARQRTILFTGSCSALIKNFNKIMVAKANVLKELKTYKTGDKRFIQFTGQEDVAITQDKYGMLHFYEKFKEVVDKRRKIPEYRDAVREIEGYSTLASDRKTKEVIALYFFIRFAEDENSIIKPRLIPKPIETYKKIVGYKEKRLKDLEKKRRKQEQEKDRLEKLKMIRSHPFNYIYVYGHDIRKQEEMKSLFERDFIQYMNIIYLENPELYAVYWTLISEGLFDPK